MSQTLTRTLSAVVLIPPVLAALWLGGMYAQALVAVATLGLLVEWQLLCRNAPSHKLAWRFFGVAYALAPMGALAWLLRQNDGQYLLCLILAVVWGADTLAYFTGRLFGGPKLAPRISPGKTWSGAAGGWVAGILVGFIYALWQHQSVPIWMAWGFALAIISQGGDLFESGIKRHFHVKDSGRLIPGHGGLFDRLDSLLAVAPVVAIAYALGLM